MQSDALILWGGKDLSNDIAENILWLTLKLIDQVG